MFGQHGVFHALHVIGEASQFTRGVVTWVFGGSTGTLHNRRHGDVSMNDSGGRETGRDKT